MKYDIFISYRRDGGEFVGKSLYDKMTEKGYKCFFDVETMRSGKFNEQLYDVIKDCKDVLVILSPGALDRCKNENDWVRNEISYAIKMNKNIIPVMLRNFNWPLELPEDIMELPNYEGINASSEYFDASIEKMKKLLCSKPKRIKLKQNNSLSETTKTIIETITSDIIKVKFIIEGCDKDFFEAAISRVENTILELKTETEYVKFSDEETYTTAKEISQRWLGFRNAFLKNLTIEELFCDEEKCKQAIDKLNDIIDYLLIESSSDAEHKKTFTEAIKNVEKNYEKRILSMSFKGRFPKYFTLILFFGFVLCWIVLSKINLIKFDLLHIILSILFIIIDLFTAFLFSALYNKFSLNHKNFSKIYSRKKSLERMSIEVQEAYEQLFAEEKKKYSSGIKKSICFCVFLAICAFLLIYTARCI